MSIFMVIGRFITGEDEGFNWISKHHLNKIYKNLTGAWNSEKFDAPLLFPLGIALKAREK